MWIDHIYLHNLDASTVRSTARTFDQSVVPVQMEGMSVMVPLSDHFGLASVIRVPSGG